MPTVTLSANTTSWTVPAGVTVLQSVTAWGAGGGGGALPSNGGTSSGGGGGGAVSIITNLAVTPGASIACQIPAGRADGVTPDDTWFSATTVLLAKAGAACPSNTQTGAQGGQASGGVGSTKYNGGDGANGVVGVGGGGGGSSAGSGAAGAAGSSTSGGAAPTDGGAGGAGALNGTTSPGANGTSPGGGGGGGCRTSRQAVASSVGGDAQIVIFYDSVTSTSATAAAGSSSTAAAGRSLAASEAAAAAGLSTTSAAASSRAAVAAGLASGSSSTAATGSSSVATGIYPPSLPIMRESSTQRLTGIEPTRASNGALRVRRYAPGEKMVFNVVHWVSDAQRTQLETTYTTGRAAALQFLWPEDAATYTVRFGDAPQYEWTPGYWIAKVTLLEV